LRAGEGCASGRCAGGRAAARGGIDRTNRRQYCRRRDGLAGGPKIGAVGGDGLELRVGLELRSLDWQPLVVERVDDGETRIARGNVDRQGREDGEQAHATAAGG